MLGQAEDLHNDPLGELFSLGGQLHPWGLKHDLWGRFNELVSASIFGYIKGLKI
jgi:hypothetical protein